jgi:DNA-binding PadR family transcriptional regulator
MMRDFFVGFAKIHILYHASQAPIYGVEIMKELKRHGYTISPGTLYPTLQSLESDGYLTGERKVIKGRMKIYYRTTAKGNKALEQAKRKINELVDEVLEK